MFLASIVLPDKIRCSFRFPRCLRVILLLSIKSILAIFLSTTFISRITTAFFGLSRLFTGEEIITWHWGSFEIINFCSLSRSSVISLAFEKAASLVPMFAITLLGRLRKRSTIYWCYMSYIDTPGNNFTFLLGPILASSIPLSMVSPAISSSRSLLDYPVFTVLTLSDDRCQSLLIGITFVCT